MQEAQETQVQSLGQEDLLEEETAMQSNILAGEIPRTEEPGGLQSMGSQGIGHALATEHSCKHEFYTQFIENYLFIQNIFEPSDDAALWTPGCPSKARSCSGLGSPRQGCEASSLLSNCVTLGNHSPLWRLRFLFWTVGIGLLPCRVVVKQYIIDVDVLCKWWSLIQMGAILPGPDSSPDSAGRWFGLQQTSDGCPDLPVHSFISPKVEESTQGTIILDSILTDQREWVGAVE